MLKNYTIPIIDLDGETWRQSLVDREKNLYLGHPTTALLDDGQTIVTVYPKCHGNGQIVLKKSLDAGKTWSNRLPVPASWSTSLEVPILYKTCEKDGTEHLLMFSSLYPIRMSHSEDNGNTWTELEPIGDYGGIVAPGDIIETSPGQYQAFFHDDGRFFRPRNLHTRLNVFATGTGPDRRTKVLYDFTQDGGKSWGNPKPNWVSTDDRPGDNWTKIYEAFAEVGNGGHFTLYQIQSDDGGLTWSPNPKPICTHNEACLCEPAAIRSPDGTEVAILLRENSRKLNSHVIFSYDNCNSWSDPVPVQGALTGDRHCARYLNDGRLFISFRDTCLDSPTHGDWCAWLGSYDDIKYGRQGTCRIRIMNNKNGVDCAYPGVIILPDGTIVTTTYGHWTAGDPAYVVSVRIHPDEIDAKLKTLIKQ